MQGIENLMGAYLGAKPVISMLDTGLWRNRRLARFFGVSPSVDFGFFSHTHTTRIGWGRKTSGLRAVRLAKRFGTSFLLLEDGFIRSIDIGKNEISLSLVFDNCGIYYDATSPSRLEHLIASELLPDQKERAKGLINLWQTEAVSKYNHSRSHATHLSTPYVLVADQTAGDASIKYGLATPASFQKMLAAALSENPTSQIVVKIHPEVLAGKKRGHFDLPSLMATPRVTVLGEDVHPAKLIDGAEVVYVVTSQIGFEGLLWGKRVRTFGLPFFAGWNLTVDELPAPNRRRSVALENLVHAALVTYARYLDPETDEPCEPERIITWLGLQRRMRERFPETLWAPGFSNWKKPIVRDFFQGSKVSFENVDVDGTCPVIQWGMASRGSRISTHLINENIYGVNNRHILRVEDGFLRSVGLGADLIRPLSWVIDQRGIYYDAEHTSDLEAILKTHVFDDAFLLRANKLKERIICSGLTKYNTGHSQWKRPVTNKKIILVVGQVESDASILFGAPPSICKVRRNIDLLQTVCHANPDAYIVYKPHPDVLAGLRKQGINENLASKWCNELVISAPMSSLLEQVDEIHVITSLAGFEGLLRGKQVICYGQPFYSGWGLTHDVYPHPQRTRRLTIDELVAGTLILYPTYISRTTLRFTTPERALDELVAWREEKQISPFWRIIFRQILSLNKN